METQNTSKEKKKAAKKAGGLILAGSMLIDIAAGWRFKNLSTDSFAGMGIDFIHDHRNNCWI